MKIGKLEILKDDKGVIISDFSYEMSDTHECIFIPKENLKELIEYLSARKSENFIWFVEGLKSALKNKLVYFGTDKAKELFEKVIHA